MPALVLKMGGRNTPGSRRNAVRRFTRREIARALSATADVGIQFLKDPRSGVPVDRGTLAKSFRKEVRPRTLEAFIFSPLRYASVMEFGRRPGGRLPPKEPILNWVMRKGLGNKELEKSLGKKESRALKARSAKTFEKKASKAITKIGLERTASGVGNIEGLVHRIRMSIVGRARTGANRGRPTRGREFYKKTARVVQRAFPNIIRRMTGGGR